VYGVLLDCDDDGIRRTISLPTRQPEVLDEIMRAIKEGRLPDE
jgi:hypothetical protein